MPTNTYVALRKETVTVATSSITFDLTGISGYTDLRIVASLKGNVGSPTDYTTLLQFNGDTASNYSRTLIRGDGTLDESTRSTGQTHIQLQTSGYLSTTVFQNILLDVFNYSNSTTAKTSLARLDQPNILAAASVGLWRKTPEAITSIRIFLESGNYGVGSTFSLYGISAIGGVTPKATGGTVTSDATYWYHTFEMSGNFVPNQSLTCDYLVVAGGGGGGGDSRGGGGGAGGLRSTVTASGGSPGTVESALSVTAQRYAITVGGGGAGAGGDGTGTSGSNSIFSTITSTGGGGGAEGGVAGATKNGVSGGSGGGGGGYTTGAGGSFTANQGFAGGTGSTNPFFGAGGGGGAGAAGASSTSDNGGAGGNGVATSISGSSVTYAGGGGGGATATGGAGGSGGGGAGANSAPTVGTINRGGGGGGGSNGAAGGSGIVILRYTKA
jgi:hypothetical protein